MKHKQIRYAVIAVLALAIFTGCQSPYGKVAIAWSRMIREQQITPIFPPREDVRIGDIFLSENDPNKDQTLSKVKDYLPIPLFIGAVPMNLEAISNYMLRGEFPLSPTNLFSVDTNGALTELTEATETNLFLIESNVDRLRQVEFPDFSSAKVDKSSLQAVIPIQGLNLLLGANQGSYTEGSLKISSGESYSLPAATVNEKVFKELFLPDNTLNPKYAELVNPILRSKNADKRKVWLTIINEVYYARSIDLSFTSKSAFGGEAGVNRTNIGQQALSFATNALAMADALSMMNSNILAQSSVGGSLSYIQASDNSIGMRRTFIRPIAIGFRGYVLKLSEDTNSKVVNRSSNIVVGGGSVNSSAKPAFTLPDN